MSIQIQIRRDTAANWTTHNPILANGEMGLEKDTNRIKFGDGINTWSNLDYYAIGEDNTASNIGAGEGLYFDKSDVDLQFKSLKSAGGVSLTSDSDSVTISGADPTVSFTDLIDTPSEYVNGKYVRTTASGIVFESEQTENIVYIHSSYTGDFSDGSFSHPFKGIYEAIVFVSQNYVDDDNVVAHMLPGEYVISYQVTGIPKAVKSVVGTSAQSVIMKPTNDLLGQPFGILDNDIKIANLTIDATDNPAFATTSGSVGGLITAGFGEQVTFDDCIIKGFYTGFECTNGSTTLLKDVSVSNAVIGLDVSATVVATQTRINGVTGKHVYAHDGGQAYLVQDSISSAYNPFWLNMGDAIYADGEGTLVTIGAGTDIFNCNRNIFVGQGAEVTVNNCILKETGSQPGIIQESTGILTIVNSRAPLGKDDLSIEFPTNVYVNAFDSTNGVTTIGNTSSVDQTIFTINADQVDNPSLEYNVSHDQSSPALAFNVYEEGSGAEIYVQSNNGDSKLAAYTNGENGFDHESELELMSFQDDVEVGWKLVKSSGSTPTFRISNEDAVTAFSADYDGSITMNSGIYTHDKNVLLDAASYSNITGILTGGALSINTTDNTKVDVEAGSSLYVNMDDRENPVVEILSWPDQEYYPSISGVETKWIGFERTGPGVGQVVSSHKFNQLEKRKITVLGRCWNFINTDEVKGVGNYKAGAFNAGKTVQDIAYTLGSQNISGNSFYATASGSMTLSRSAGEAFRFGANYTNSNISPNIYISTTEDPRTEYSYHIQGHAADSYSEIDPDYYDLNGTRTAVPSGKWTVQRVYYYPVSDVVVVTYGQALYDDHDDAVAGIANEDVVLNTGTLEGAILRAFVLVKSGATDLTDSLEASVLEAATTGAGGSSGGGVGITDHGALSGLSADDHEHYTLANGTRDFGGKVSYSSHPTFSTDTEIVDKKYVDDSIGGLTTDHGGLTGLGDDDHTQYTLVAGTRAFTGKVSYNSHPSFTTDTELVDKKYVDDEIGGLTADHGELTGLGDDDHTQYHTDARGDARYAPIAKGVTNGDSHDHSGGDGAQIDHGSTGGLSDDDHPQYHTDARGDLRYYTQGQVDTISEGIIDDFVQLVTLATTQVHRTTDLALTTSYQNITFSVLDVETDPTVIEWNTTNKERINIKEAGVYKIEYLFSARSTGATRYVYARALLNGTTEIPGSYSLQDLYADETHQQLGICVVELAANDYVTIQTYAASTPVNTFAGHTLTITKLNGLKGDPGADGADGADGAPGSGSTITVKDEGTNVANTPHSAFNFVGTGVNVTDAGSGVATVNVSGGGITVKDEGATVTGGPHTSLNFIGTAVTAINAGTGQANVTVTPIFGSHYAYAESVNTNNSNSTSWQTKVTLNVSNLTAGTYRLGFYCTQRGTSASYDIQGRILQNGSVQLVEWNTEPKDVNSYYPQAGFANITATAGSNHTFTLQYSVESSNTTSYIRNAKLEFWRVS